jgi:Type I site-specific restriction-modification system, R (restriction) subunit and related helicases
MPESPEARARKNIDQLLTDAGWIIQSREDVNLAAGRGIAIREFPMKPGFGEADYLLYVDGQALGVVEAKKEGSTLTGFEGQTVKYSEALPDALPHRTLGDTALSGGRYFRWMESSRRSSGPAKRTGFA